MVIVEFFDKPLIENVISGLTVNPEKVIFLGEASVMKKQKEIFARFFKEKGLQTVTEYVPIIKNSLESIVSALETIIAEYESCAFDLTGGEDLALVAMGIVYEKHKSEGKIQLHRYNVRTGRVFDCDGDGISPQNSMPEISINENIMLYGGRVEYEKQDGKGTYEWVFSDEFLHDINCMWEICREDPAFWNSQISALGELEKIIKNITENSSLSANDEHEKSSVFEARKKCAYILDRLIACELINDDYLALTYKNEQIKRCLAKAGTILELKMYLTLKNMRDSDGRKVYSDALNGVCIDWDGNPGEPKQGLTKDTENEIDIILMKGLVPYFISCKNGYVGDEELYKLSTVANRFGDTYARKVLLATYLGKSADSLAYFKHRAADMKIHLITDVHTLDDKELEKTLKQIEMC